VKTGTDPLAGSIDLTNIKDTSIAEMVALPVPPGFGQDASRLPNSAETQVWRIKGTLVEYKQEADSDIHGVVSDGQGHTMIVEFPLPSCVGANSPFLPGITKARAEFEAKFAPSSGHFTPANVPVIITGVGFFDTIHGQTGVAPNGVEEHPVLDIQFAP
jgi:hypothetical protein